MRIRLPLLIGEASRPGKQYRTRNCCGHSGTNCATQTKWNSLVCAHHLWPYCVINCPRITRIFAAKDSFWNEPGDGHICDQCRVLSACHTRGAGHRSFLMPPPVQFTSVPLGTVLQGEKAKHRELRKFTRFGRAEMCQRWGSTRGSLTQLGRR